MPEKLKGKVAVVTGASKGIGASITIHLAGEGAAVVVNYSSSKEGAERVVEQIVGKSTVTPPNSVVYNATKAAVDAVTRVLSKELAAPR